MWKTVFVTYSIYSVFYKRFFLLQATSLLLKDGQVPLANPGVGVHSPAADRLQMYLAEPGGVVMNDQYLDQKNYVNNYLFNYL